MDLIRALLRVTPPSVETLIEWRRATIADREIGETPVDRALLGGALADRLGFAFASGYGEALRALVPGLEGIAALCITEAAGNAPRAIETTLVQTAPGAYELSGHKKWATVGSLASSLLVAASIGRDCDRNHIRMVRVLATAPGVHLVETTAPFVPEIPHAEITFERVPVREADLLAGDGYTEYIKPFRTIEDIHVHAALVGYLIGVARRKGFGRDTLEPLLALATTTRAAAACNARSAGTHVVLAGLFTLVARELSALEAKWAAAPDAEWQRWQRDRALLQVAGKARAARRETAWSQVEGR